MEGLGRHIDFEQDPPNIAGIIFIPNSEGDWKELKLPREKKDAIEVEVEDGVFVDVYGGGRKFMFRVRYDEEGRKKSTNWYDSSWSPLQKINANDSEAPFFWQVAKEYGLSNRYPASHVWYKKGKVNSPN